MNSHTDNLARRRLWYHYFPEGTIEFLLVTRVLALLILAALAVVHGTQLDMALIALGLLLLADALIIQWWGVQIVTDLSDLKSQESSRLAARRRLRAWVLAALPALIMVVTLLPWSGFVIYDPAMRARVNAWIPLIGVPLYLAALVPAVLGLRAIHYGATAWCVCWLIPGIQWWALHRLIGDWQARIDQSLGSRRKETEPPSTGTVLFVDIMWVLAMLAVAGLFLVGTLRTEGLQGGGPRLLIIAGTGLVALFAIGQVAVMENVQRRFLAAVMGTRSDSPASGVSDKSPS